MGKNRIRHDKSIVPSSLSTKTIVNNMINIYAINLVHKAHLLRFPQATLRTDPKKAETKNGINIMGQLQSIIDSTLANINKKNNANIVHSNRSVIKSNLEKSKACVNNLRYWPRLSVGYNVCSTAVLSLWYFCWLLNIDQKSNCRFCELL